MVLVHRLTGGTVEGSIPEGHYSKRKMSELREALLAAGNPLGAVPRQQFSPQPLCRFQRKGRGLVRTRQAALAACRGRGHH